MSRIVGAAGWVELSAVRLESAARECVRSMLEVAIRQYVKKGSLISVRGAVDRIRKRAKRGGAHPLLTNGP